MSVNRYSASELIKRSAAQLVFFREANVTPPVTAQMRVGEAYQHNISEKFKSEGHKVADEMCGCYTYDENAIYFCIDIVRDDEFVEVKSVLDENKQNSLIYPEWYFQSSILQCAVYKSLLIGMDGCTLTTPKFRLDAGYELITKEVNKSLPYRLKFGEVGTYTVDVLDENRIIKFIKDKINALENFSTARAFDDKFKHREFDFLKDCFTYSKIA